MNDPSHVIDIVIMNSPTPPKPVKAASTKASTPSKDREQSNQKPYFVNPSNGKASISGESQSNTAHPVTDTTVRKTLNKDGSVESRKKSSVNGVSSTQTKTSKSQSKKRPVVYISDDDDDLDFGEQVSVVAPKKEKKEEAATVDDKEDISWIMDGDWSD